MASWRRAGGDACARAAVARAGRFLFTVGLGNGRGHWRRARCDGRARGASWRRARCDGHACGAVWRRAVPCGPVRRRAVLCCAVRRRVRRVCRVAPCDAVWCRVARACRVACCVCYVVISLYLSFVVFPLLICCGMCLLAVSLCVCAWLVFFVV